MNILPFVFLLVLSTIVHAETPYENFSVDSNITNKVNIEWQYADDIQAACDKQRQDNGEKPYTYKVQACSIWYEHRGYNTCVIITKKTLNMWSLGHEIRHCFQGAFHQ